MQKLEQVPQADMSEVVRVAGEMYDREHTEARERKATVDAAEEIGIPAEYMERAAREVQARRIAEVRQRRSTRKKILAVLAAFVVASGGAWLLTPAPPPAPYLLAFDGPAATRVAEDINPGTEATAKVVDGVGIITVDRFSTGSDGSYRANLDLPAPATLQGYKRVSFRVRGQGTLEQVRLYLENGATERWRSPAVRVTGDWQTVTLDLGDMEYQTRGSSAERWRTVRSRRPDEVKNLSFKAGEFMNDVSARGEIRIDDLQFR